MLKKLHWASSCPEAFENAGLSLFLGIEDLNVGNGPQTPMFREVSADEIIGVLIMACLPSRERAK